jgi:uncharacterized protein (TIGR00730 family)
MARLKSLCVYCGSSDRVDPLYREAAVELGRLLAAEKIELVYGGGRIGLMGLCANAVLAGGGRVTGIIPAHLHDAEVGHHGVSELLVVGSMHERKRRMFELSDAFAVLPGGLGTLDEAFEIITWRQLGLHDKPIVVVDVAGYWAPFQAMVDHIVEQGFARSAIFSLYETVSSVAELIPTIRRLHEPAIAPEPRLV